MEFVVSRVGSLQPLVKQIVESEEVERARYFNDIFVQIAKTHLNTILAGDTSIIEILIELVGLPNLDIYE